MALFAAMCQLPLINNMKSQVKSIAFLRMSAIGDVVLCIPAIIAIQKKYPSASITWITDSQSYGLLKGLDGVDFISFHKPRNLSDYISIVKKLRGYDFDILLAAQASLRANVLYPFIKARRKIGFDKKRSRDGHYYFVNENIIFREEHLVEGFMAFAKHIGVDSNDYKWNLPVSDIDIKWARELCSDKKGKYIVIHPSASKVERNWNANNFSQLINILTKKYGFNIILTGGNSNYELNRNSEINKISGFSCLDLTGKISLKKLAALLRAVDVLIAPDTGPVHIATAMNTPVIGLYAVITSRLSGPWESQDLIIDKYYEAAEKILNINAKNLQWGKRVHSEKAMDLISVNDVLEKIHELFSRGSRHITAKVAD
jgi:heptosyltransferase I